MPEGVRILGARVSAQTQVAVGEVSRDELFERMRSEGSLYLLLVFEAAWKQGMTGEIGSCRR